MGILILSPMHAIFLLSMLDTRMQLKEDCIFEYYNMPVLQWTVCCVNLRRGDFNIGSNL